jgi:hypothetical protein
MLRDDLIKPLNRDGVVFDYDANTIPAALPPVAVAPVPPTAPVTR